MTASSSAASRIPTTQSGRSPVLDTCSSFLGEHLVRASASGPQAEHVTPLVWRVAIDLAEAGWAGWRLTDRDAPAHDVVTVLRAS